MSDQQWSDWYSAPDLAPRLNLSIATLKRRLTQWSRDGQPIVLTDGRSVEIQAEKIARPQGDEWRVRLRGALPDVSADPERSVSKEPPPLTGAQSDDQGATLALETIAGLVERNAVLSDRVAALEREAGRATASADLLAAQLAESQATLARERVVSEARAADLERERHRSWLDRLLGRRPTT